MRKVFCLMFAFLLPLPAAAQEAAVAVFDEADANGDGKITRPEFSAAREKRFIEMDRNKDGAVARDDFGILLSLAPSRGQRLDAFIASADANNDKRLTLVELRASPMRLFDRADANGDQVVDAAELKAFRAALKAGNPGRVKFS